MTPQDHTIKDKLTGWPTYVPEWDEYAAVDLDGNLHTAYSIENCRLAVQSANEYIARHRAAQLAAAWEAYAEAADIARANLEEWLAEIQENQSCGTL